MHVVEARRRHLALLLRQNGYMPVRDLCDRLGVSEATVRRDLVALESENKIKRTYGGALVDFNLRFPSFQQRQLQSPEAKRRIGLEALKFLQPGFTCFLDSGTTIHAVAEVIREQLVLPLTIVTGNLPVAEALAQVEEIQVFLLGGRFLQRQSVLLGDRACDTARKWKFDLAFMGSEGLDAAGVWNSQHDVVKLQKTVMERSDNVAFCLDRTKIGSRGPQFLSKWKPNYLLLTDADSVDLIDQSIRLSSDCYRKV